MKPSFWLTLLAAGLLALALRPLLVTGGEPASASLWRGEQPTHSASIAIAPLPEPVAKPLPKRVRPRGRTIDQILANPLGSR